MSKSQFKECVHSLIVKLVEAKITFLLDLILSKNRDSLPCKCTSHLELASCAVFMACNQKDTEVIKYLFQKYHKPNTLMNNVGYIDVNFKHPIHRRTLLYNAIYNNNYDASDLLLQKGADIHEMYSNNESIVYWCLCHSDIKMLKLLISYGANCNPTCPDVGYYPLYYAVMKEKIEIIKLLLDNGANTRYQAKYDIFMITLKYSDLDAFKILLQYTLPYSYDFALELVSRARENHFSESLISDVVKIVHGFIYSPINYSINLQNVLASREFDENSLFHPNYLIKDLFVIILQNAMIEHLSLYYEF